MEMVWRTQLLAAVLARGSGLRTDRRLSHVFIMDVPTYHKVLLVTDAAINIAPDLDAKADICRNAIDLALAMGVEQPKVAILAAVRGVRFAIGQVRGVRISLFHQPTEKGAAPTAAGSSAG